MSLDPIDRRELPRRSAAWRSSAPSPASRSPTDQGQIDVDGLAKRGRGAAEGRGRRAARRRARRSRSDLGRAWSASAARRANTGSPPRPVEWNIVPTHRDQMMAEPVKGEDHVQRLRLPRPTAPNFEHPLGAGDGAGAADRSRSRRHRRRPLPQQAEGAGDDAPARDLLRRTRWTAPTRASSPTPAASSSTNRTFTYVWEANEGTEGTWLYHDHGPMDPLPVFKGLFGPLVDPQARAKRGPKREFFLAFHTWDPSITGLQGHLLLHQRQAYAGNTPNLEAKVGQRVALPRLRGRQLLPHLPPARPPLDRTGRDDRRQQNVRPGRLLPGRIHRGQPGALVLPLPRLPAPPPGDERVVPRLLGDAALALGASRRSPCSRSPAAALGQQHPGLDRQLRLVEPGGPRQPRREGHLGLARPRPRALGHRDLRRTTCSGTPTPAPTPPTTAPATPSRCSSTSPAPTSSSASCTPSSAARWSSPTRPGNPNSDPGPQPPLNIDVTPPTLGGVSAAHDRATSGNEGRAGFSAQISERGTLDAEYYRFNSKGQRVYNGYKTWNTFIGINHLALGGALEALQGEAGPLRSGAAGDRHLRKRLEAGARSASRSSAEPTRRQRAPACVPAATPLRARALAGLRGVPQGPFAGLLGRLAHRDLEHRQQRVGGERAHPVERLAHLRPVLLGAAGLVERLPDLLDEEVDVGAGGALGVAAQLRRRWRGRPRG